jgi:hypothetical protein
MTATLTITLSSEVLKALKAAKDITVAVGPGGDGAGPAPRAAPAKAARASRATDGEAGPYRAGSLPARLLSWASGRKRPFGVAEVMKKLKIKRAHASMVLTRVAGSGHVKRVGRGEYAAK